MAVINFYDEAEILGETKRKDIVRADQFTITLHKGSGKLHTCGKDEFYFLIKGEGELIIEQTRYSLKQGEGILVKAGDIHKRDGSQEACWLVTAKQPHKHVYPSDA